MKLVIVIALAMASTGAAWAGEPDTNLSSNPSEPAVTEEASSNDGTPEFDPDDFVGEAVVIEGQATIAEPGTAVWSTETLAEVAGNQGDALRGLARVAGVARPALGQREPGLSIWGTEASQSQVYLDDIPVPRLLHLGGQRAILPSSALDAVTLIPGAPSPRYGRVLGGVVEVHSTRLDGEAMRGSAYVDAIDSGMWLEGPAGSNTRLRVGARQSLIAQSFALMAPASVEGLVPLPDTWDHQVQLEHRLSSTERLKVHWFGSVDFIERSVPTQLENRSIREEQSDAFQRIGLSLIRRSTSAERKIVAYAGLDRFRSDSLFLDVQTSDRKRNRVLGLLISEARDLGYGMRLALGLDGQLEMSRHRREGALSLPPREGDITAFGVGPGQRVSADTWNVSRAQLGLFAGLQARLGSRWVLEPGLRIEPGSYDGDRVFPVRATEPAVGYSELDVAVEPRLGARLQVTRRISLFARIAQLQQSPDSADLSPVFGSPVLEPGRARQALAGLEWLDSSGVRAEVMGLASTLDRLTARADTPTPALAALLTSDGEGRTFGGHLRVEGPLGRRLQLQFGYTYMRSERRLHREAEWRPFDFDQPHRLRSAVQWRRGPWSLGAALDLVSGLPRTPVVGAIFDTARQQYEPIFGAQNSERLPFYAQASGRLSYRHRWGRLWLDIINLTNRRNVEERYFSSDFQRVGAISGLPFMPIAGAEVTL